MAIRAITSSRWLNARGFMPTAACLLALSSGVSNGSGQLLEGRTPLRAAMQSQAPAGKVMAGSAAQLMTAVTMHSRWSSSDYWHATRARRAGAPPETHPDRSNMPFQRGSS
jgi:hypothetical protein